MLYQAAVFIHVLSAVIWVGGLLFLVMVLVPLSRRDRGAGGAGLTLLRNAAQRFLPVAWGAMALLAITGAYIAWDNWGVRPGSFFTGDGHFLRTLQIKTGLFILVIAFSLFHDFWLGPRVVTQLENRPTTEDSKAGNSARVLLIMLARINMLAILAILVLAVLLIRP